MKDYPYNIENTFYAKNEYMFSKSAASLCSGKFGVFSSIPFLFLHFKAKKNRLLLNYKIR